MDAEHVLKVAVSVWGVAMAVSPVMQVRQMLRTGESKDVSVPYFVVLSIGFVLWVLYGISIDSKILAICNTVAFVFAVATIAVALRLRRTAQAPGHR